MVAGDQTFEAPIVVSAIDAQRVFGRLIRRPVLGVSLERRVGNTHAHYPSLFKVDVALSGRPSSRRPDGDEAARREHQHGELVRPRARTRSTTTPAASSRPTRR